MQEFITNQEMSNYLNMTFNSEIFQKIISSCRNYSSANDVFAKLGNALAKYYISTMDNSIEGISLVCNLFVKEYLNNRFDELFMDLLIDRCSQMSGLDREPTISEKVTIVEQISNRNLQNMFYTHCFPGALYEIVSTNGLDISNELFKDELSLLEKHFKTAYKVGKLCYCEFSSASLSYATYNVPERINFALGGITREEGSNKYEWYLNSFKNNLSLLLKERKITQNEFLVMFEAGKRIIDFYCLNQNSCIAVFRNPISDNAPKRTILFNNIHVDNKLRGTFIGNKISELIKRCQLEPDKISTILAQGVLELEAISPELKDIFIEILNSSLREYLLSVGIKNYLHGGFADGYEISSGKLSTSEFSIVRCKCPTDLWNITKNSEHLFKQPEEKQPKEDSLSDLSLVSKILESASKQENLPERIERIHLGKSDITVYFYGDKPIFPNNYLIKEENETYQIAMYSRRVLINRWVSAFSNSLEQNEQSVIDDIVEKYKTSEQYMPEDEVVDALRWYASEIFNSYSAEVQEQLLQTEALKAGIITISFEEDYHITTGSGDITTPRNVLVDINDSGRYNNLYASIIEEQRNKIK